MIVECQNCQKKFTLEEEKYVGKRVSIRCSKCQSTFAVLGPPSPVTAAESEALPPEFQEFLDRLTKELPKELLAEGIEEKIFEEEPSLKERSPRPAPFWLGLVPTLTLILVAILAVAFTYGFLSSARQKQVVVEGGIDITDLTAYYGENKHAGLIFAVEGKVVNRYPRAKSFVKLKGQLFDRAGKAVKVKEVYAGNLLSRQELADLPRDRIETTLATKEGHAQANVNLVPRQAVPFTLVFFDLSKDISEYSLQVVAAEDAS